MIKRPQSKEALTVLVIVVSLILIGGIFFYGYNKSNESTESDSGERLVGDLSNEGLILSHISQIESQGYKVSYYGYNFSSNEAVLKMNSFGDLRDELWVGLDSLRQIYPNALFYSVEIKDARYNCEYRVERLYFWDEIGDRLSYRNFKKETPEGVGWVYARDVRKQIYVDEAYIGIDYIIKNRRSCEYS